MYRHFIFSAIFSIAAYDSGVKIIITIRNEYKEEMILIGLTEKVSDAEAIVNLLTIYDKADVDIISDKELKELIKLHKLYFYQLKK